MQLSSTVPKYRVSTTNDYDRDHLLGTWQHGYARLCPAMPSKIPCAAKQRWQMTKCWQHAPCHSRHSWKDSERVSNLRPAWRENIRPAIRFFGEELLQSGEIKHRIILRPFETNNELHVEMVQSMRPHPQPIPRLPGSQSTNAGNLATCRANQASGSGGGTQP